jgi:hypothetical protein
VDFVLPLLGLFLRRRLLLLVAVLFLFLVVTSGRRRFAFFPLLPVLVLLVLIVGDGGENGLALPGSPGLEKTRVSFLKKTSPVVFLVFLNICPKERVFRVSSVSRTL